MRINIYHHEIPFMIDRVEVVETRSDTGSKFYGIRLYTEPPVMHHDDDDDSSAITIWGIAHQDERGHTSELRELASAMIGAADEIDQRVGTIPRRPSTDV